MVALCRRNSLFLRNGASCVAVQQLLSPLAWLLSRIYSCRWCYRCGKRERQRMCQLNLKTKRGERETYVLFKEDVLFMATSKPSVAVSSVRVCSLGNCVCSISATAAAFDAIDDEFSACVVVAVSLRSVSISIRSGESNIQASE
jgi:hypothetical protein